MASEMLEHNETLGMFSGTENMLEHRQLGFLGLFEKTNEINAEAAAKADVLLKFPFPPKDCNDAALQISKLNAAIKDTQEQLASGSTNRVGQRYLTAYQQVLASFNQWQATNKCEAAATQADNENYYNTVLNTLNQSKTSGTVKITDNLIVYGIAGVAVIGVLIIILRKRK